MTPKSTSPFPLMNLPAELRLKIWRFYLVLSGPIKNRHFQSLSDILLRPLLLSRQLLPEVREVLWSDNTIFTHVTYERNSACRPFPVRLCLPTPAVLPLIKHLEVDLTPQCYREMYFWADEIMDTVNAWNKISCHCLSTVKLIVPTDAMKERLDSHIWEGTFGPESLSRRLEALKRLQFRTKKFIIGGIKDDEERRQLEKAVKIYQ
ncbi:hypothetical protein AOQ84DRAFT_379965 [Glonium stellatum]|uniref:F-box domain-containing protein n=1 Tax=Glonium stellatum TaxID=574774 RepID=A0A8E2EUH1_9PEZI|nr:hypothetical protein AOQ84DRAFT_379965 [Glonium stellatum]